MKKIIALILVVMMAFGVMVGCGQEEEPASAGAPIKTSGKKIDLTVKHEKIGEESKPVKTEIPEGKPHVISISVDQKVIALQIGTKSKITYSVLPETAYDKSVYYESTNTAVAKVDKDGNVLGVGCGAAEIIIRTNDQGFKRIVNVIVYQNGGNKDKAKEMLDLINKGREANNKDRAEENKLAPLTADSEALNAAANQRALEEAVDMVNNKKKVMDKERTDKKTTIFADYGIFVRQNVELYVWGDYSKDTKKAYEALVKTEDNAKALGIKGDANVTYDNIAVGYFVFNDVTYWCILAATT